ncbi:glycoside hydrolase family 16 protein [Diplodia corticola]|uniref:Glycoside hydrolase family 16 protein n=1 Tax=Diplodia corticola TaxID=236234 RepID=A0A1J9RAG1_9PEZI|nr:glycoside hydrolase family 16 protein [Diplodia corticola]OJD38582.1 glycoside hydrolase family 16 protein [Diplodia corticola]
MWISRRIIPTPHLHLVSLLLLSTRLLHAVRADDDDTDGDDDEAVVLKDNSPNCTCYTLDSGTSDDMSPDNSEPYYFTYHRFWDFRSLATSAGQFSSKGSDGGTAPDPVTDDEDEGLETVADQDAAYLNGSAWNADWGIQNWGKEATADFPVRMRNSARNVYISQTNASDTGNDDIEFPTYLTLRTVRLDDFQSAAEVENLQKNVMHASLRMRARVVGDAGAVAGFFTVFDDDNESDIEILTADPDGVIRYTNQPSLSPTTGDDVPHASLRVAALPSWRDWHDHRIDWLPGRTNWFLDGVARATNTYSVPRRPSYLVLNMWSDGGEWSGNMSVGGAAELQVQWVEVVFNVSGAVGGPAGAEGDEKRKRRGVGVGGGYDDEEGEEGRDDGGLGGWMWRRMTGRGGGGAEEKKTNGSGALGKRKEKRCDVVCSVDGVNVTGFPEIAHVSAAPARLLTSGVSGWVLVVVVGLATAVVGL